MSSKALEVADYYLRSKSDENGAPVLKRILKKILWDAAQNETNRTEFSELSDWVVVKLELFGFLVSFQDAQYRKSGWIVAWRTEKIDESVGNLGDLYDDSESSSLIGSSPPAGLFLRPLKTTLQTCGHN